MFLPTVQRVDRSDLMLRWYVAQSQPKLESLAAISLGQLGFETFLPLMERKDFSTAPLFPRYLFVMFDRSQDQWRSILSARGIMARGAGLVALQGDIPSPIPFGCVEELQRRAGSGEFCERPSEDAPLLELDPGEAVRVTGGTYQGFDGLVRRSAAERVTVMLSMFKRPNGVPVEIERRFLEKAA